MTIEPGALLRFPAFSDDQGGGIDASRSELIVEGSLVAEGTEAEPILFTSSSSAPAKGDWHGIRVLTRSGDESVTLSHCTVEYGSIGIAVEANTYNAVVSITDSVIRETGGDGIYIYGESGSTVTVDLINNEILGNDGKGVSVG